MSVGAGDSVETLWSGAIWWRVLAVAIVTPAPQHPQAPITSQPTASTTLLPSIEKVNHDDSALWLALEICFRRRKKPLKGHPEKLPHVGRGLSGG